MLFEEQTVALSHRVYPRARLNLLMERITKKPTKTVGKTWKSKETIADNFNYFMLRYGLEQPSGVMIVERLGHMENSKPFGWYSNRPLCMIRSHGTKSRILVGKLRNRTFQTKGRSTWTGTSCIVLEVPLRNLLTSMCDFVPCDRVVQKAYWNISQMVGIFSKHS